ncbi:transposase DDE domain protein [Burkholderia pseudomallei]|nr:transposase DDE domain protein [Burkholderia pseudomallei]
MIRVSVFAEHEREAVAPSGVYRLQMSPPCGTGPYGRQFRRRSSRACAATEANGTPIAAILTGANRNDVTQRIPVIEAIEPINGVRGRPLSRPKRVYADRGYGRDEYRRIRHARGIPPSIARRGEPRGSGSGKIQWIVERTHAGMHRILRLRYTIRTSRRHSRGISQTRVRLDLREQLAANSAAVTEPSPRRAASYRTSRRSRGETAAKLR